MSNLRIWINAFIPLDVPGYTRVVPAGPRKGATAVPLPWLAQPVNWKPLDTGYLGDQRGFSDDPNASVRMQSSVGLSLTGTRWTVGPEEKGTSSGTTEVNLRTGRIQGHSVANMSGAQFRKESDGIVRNEMRVLGGQPAAIPVSDNDQSAVTLYVDAAATDPLVRFAFPIRYHGSFFLSARSQGAVSLRWDLRICEFPAFEAYASYRGVTKALFQVPPQAGRTVVDLLKGSNQPQAGSTTL